MTKFSAVSIFSAKLAKHALLREIELTPKPGLVDRLNSGAHRDMDYALFLSSIHAISPFFEQFYSAGKQFSAILAKDFLAKIRPIGLLCEQSMFDATNGVNTHKGGIFAFGLICSVIGRLEKSLQIINAKSICAEIAHICENIVEKELKQIQITKTIGENLFKKYGLTGARGEAESGYSTVLNVALPVFLETLGRGYNEETALLQTLLYLFAYNNDTNIVSRGGMNGLQFLQQNARKLIHQGGMLIPDNYQKWMTLDNALIARNLSPGGSADLLAITWFLSHYC